MSDDSLTSEELEKGTRVAQAATEAAANEPDPDKRRAATATAARREAEKVQIELSEEDANKLADAIIHQLDIRGAFAPPPEPVSAPPAAPPEQPTQPTAAPAAPAEPHRQSFAERFRSRS
jgi:hypothetical protein